MYKDNREWETKQGKTVLLEHRLYEFLRSILWGLNEQVDRRDEKDKKTNLPEHGRDPIPPYLCQVIHLFDHRSFPLCAGNPMWSTRAAP